MAIGIKEAWIGVQEVKLNLLCMASRLWTAIDNSLSHEFGARGWHSLDNDHTHIHGVNAGCSFAHDPAYEGAFAKLCCCISLNVTDGNWTLSLDIILFEQKSEIWIGSSNFFQLFSIFGSATNSMQIWLFNNYKDFDRSSCWVGTRLLWCIPASI